MVIRGRAVHAVVTTPGRLQVRRGSGGLWRPAYLKQGQVAVVEG